MYMNILLIFLVVSVYSAFGVVNNGKKPPPECCVPEEDPPDKRAILRSGNGPASQQSEDPRRSTSSKGEKRWPVKQQPRGAYSNAAYTIYDPSPDVEDYEPILLDADAGQFGIGAAGYHYIPQEHYTSHQYSEPTKNKVKIIKGYRKENQKTGPVYKESIVMKTRTGDNQPTIIRYHKQGKPGRYNVETTPPSRSTQYVVINQPEQKTKYRTEYSSKKNVRFPEDRSRAQYKEASSESSSYNKGVSYKNSYKQPPKSINEQIRYGDNDEDVEEVNNSDLVALKPLPQTLPPRPLPTIAEKISEQPLDTAGSIGQGFISGHIDDGLLPEDDGYGHGYEQEKGKHYAQSHKAKEGHKSEKDFKKSEHHSKGEEEKHGSHHDKGSASEKSGEKKGHVDEGKKYTAGHEASKGAKATDFLHKKGHHKGHKKTGYHRVHHKDEFKKDETFFDETHDTGEESAHGHSGKEHAHKHGHEEKQGHHDSGHHEANHKKHGGHEQGHSHHQNAGHHKEEAHQAHHSAANKHASKEGHKEAEKHGHEAAHEGHIL